MKALLLICNLLALVLHARGELHNYFSTSGNQIVNSYGDAVRIAGVNYFGFETSSMVLHGLTLRSYKSILDQVKTLGFNTLRLPYSNDMVISRETDFQYDISYPLNPDLRGLTPMEILDEVVRYCTKIDLRIILDRHSCKAGGINDEELWYIPQDKDCTEDVWINDWIYLATRYKDNATVIGADLFNEPKGELPTWGNSNGFTDWNKAAERAGNAILEIQPRWLIFVEGIFHYAGFESWWGANLKGAMEFPVVLAVKNQLVYSVHDYPASVMEQEWLEFSIASKMLNYWTSTWGYIFIDGMAPMYVGEFGTKLQTDEDKVWLDYLVDYMNGDFILNGKNQLAGGQKGMSFTYWCLNPNSDDTGGILKDDWTTVHTDKMENLKRLLDPQSVSLNMISSSPTLLPTHEPTLMPVSSPSTFLVSFVVDNITEAYTTTGGYATALTETTAIILDLELSSVVATSSAGKAGGGKRSRLLYSAELYRDTVAFVSATVDNDRYPGYETDSSALYMSLHGILRDSIKDGSFTKQYRKQLLSYFPGPLINLANPAVVVSSVGKQLAQAPLPPTAAPTVISLGASSSSSTDEQTEFIVIIAVVGGVGLLTLAGLYFCWEYSWKHDALTTNYDASSTRLPASSKMKGGDSRGLLAVRLFEKSTREHDGLNQPMSQDQQDMLIVAGMPNSN